MISVIICSRKTSVSNDLHENVMQTIGVDNEVICIDNSDGRYSIFEAYNIGVSRSKYPILCFMHDDIFYKTVNWGQRVTEHFYDEKVSAIGVAGSPYYPFMPGPWWGSAMLYQTLYQSAQPDETPVLKNNSDGQRRRQVVVLDGVWFCIRKEAFEKVKFDADTFKGFQLYDADICLQLHSAGLKMFCINDVLLHHSSMGNLNKSWLDGDLIFRRKWKKQLPATCISLTNNQLCRLELKVLNGFIWIAFNNGWSNKKIYSFALKQLLSFKPAYGFYKTPGYLLKFFYKMLFKKGEPFYS